jgi:hypothetical protein
VNPSAVELAGATLFALAIVHTFCTWMFEHLAHARPAHAGLWHLLGEVEVVFGFWAMVLALFMFAAQGMRPTLEYLDTRAFTEPMFVFAIMVVAGSRPILELARRLVDAIARILPGTGSTAFAFSVLAVVPLLGSLITEPAAMTLAAMLLRDRLFVLPISNRLRYAVLGVLFVNVSIGGTLTPFAAPPVLMVAASWNWDVAYMMTHFGGRAALAVCVNALLLAVVFRRELSGAVAAAAGPAPDPVPAVVIVVHLVFLAGIVAFGHHPSVFMALLMFFIGFAWAYQRHQDPLILREGLLVAFFLGGLVVLGGVQRWWLEPLLLGLSARAVFFGAVALTAITDNAALTYLGSLAQGLTDEFKIALVAGAVTGGGLTVIANAPNPAGFAILRGSFDEGAIRPLGLFAAALAPTGVAIAAFRFL